MHQNTPFTPLGEKHSGKKFIFNHPTDQCSLQVDGAILKQIEKFKYLGVAFTSDREQDEELHTRIGKAIVQVMRALHSSVVMKRELSK